MNRYVIFDGTGEILRVVRCEEEQADIQAGPGEFLVESGVGDWDTHQVVDGVVVAYSAADANKKRKRPFDNATWSNALLDWVDTRTIDKCKSDKRQEMRAARDKKMLGGFKSATLDYDSDTESQAAIQIAVTQALVAKIDNTAFSVVWTLSDDSEVTLDKTAMLKVGKDLQQMLDNAQTKFQARKGAIKAATTVAEVEAITW